MPTLAEFILTISTSHNREEHRQQTIFRFETFREFRSFRYEVDVDGTLDPEKREISFRLKGVGAPATLMTSTGSARSELIYDDLLGEYRIEVRGAKKSGAFRIMITAEGVKLLDPIDADFVQIRLHEGVATTGEQN